MKRDKYIHPTLECSLAIHEALRKLGFSAEDIDPLWSPGRLQIVLSHADKTFVIDVEGSLPFSHEEMKKRWQEARQIWNERLSPEEALAVYYKHFSEEKLLALAIALDDKGIEPPAVAEMRRKGKN